MHDEKTKEAQQPPSQQHKGDTKLPEIEDNVFYYGTSLARHFAHLMLLMMKLRGLKMLFLPVTVTLLLSNLYLSVLLDIKIKAERGNSRLTFYGPTDFSASGSRVLVDRSAFKAEASSAASIMSDRGVNRSSWLVACSPESSCRSELVGERDASVIGYIRYSKTLSSKRAILECFWEDDSSLRCAFLYQLMAQSMYNGTMPDSVFKDVQFFSLNTAADASLPPDGPKKSERKLSLELPKSVCASWINEATFNDRMNIVTSASLVLITIGVSFHLLITTVSSIRALKEDGFFQQLVRNGLSVTSYWAVVWVTIVVECVLFSGIFVLSHILHCPGVYPPGNVARILLIFSLYCLSLAGIVLLLELLVSSILAIFLLMMATSVGLSVAFMSSNALDGMAPFAFPPMLAKRYILDHLTSSVTRLMDGTDPVSERPKYYLAIVLTIGATVLLLVLLTAYLDFLVPGGNGLCLPPCYPFSRSFWCQGGYIVEDDDEAQTVELESRSTEAHIEPAVGDLSPAIIVDKITKVYRDRACCYSEQDGQRVLFKVSCAIYRDQITALIGHNGAGKSTLIRILTGEECPTNGVAYANGFKATDPIERLALRGSISVCPQQDALCNALTVIECIRVTLISKGVSGDEELNRARSMLQRLGMADKENTMPAGLSSGQKRKVSTILALLGDPDVAFLDEPTSGLDPVSRRQVWRLLQEEKIGRAIVLCTQFMDEADILADRKIFLCGGEIVCAGSSMFLKQAFGCSFALTVSLKSEKDSQDLMARLTGVRLKSQFKTELQLEVGVSNSKDLVKAVQVLETSDRVEAFGLSQASLDEIFMKLRGVNPTDVIDAFREGELSEFLAAEEDERKATPATAGFGQSLDQFKKVVPSSCRQFGALFRTNLRRQTRSRSRRCSRFVVPVLLLIALGLVNFSLTNYFTIGRRTVALDNFPSKAETDSFRKVSEVRSMDFASSDLMVVCLHDGEATPSFSDLCASLSLHSSVKLYAVINKPHGSTLKNFLGQSSTLSNLISACGASDGSPCVVYYASSWAKSEPNRGRTVTIGVITSDKGWVRTEPVHAYRRAFARVSQFFQAGELQNTTALSHLRRCSLYNPFKVELIIFLCIFVLFPTSFLSDPIEDISSKVRDYLLSMGMSHIAYWMNTFIVHWIQYATCFTISVLLLFILDQYRNVHFIVAACLPAFILGTASNQMMMYAIAAVTRVPSSVVSLTCPLLAAVLPLALYASILTGKTFVLQLIWLLPPVAPLALIYFSVIQSAYSLEYYNVEHGSGIPNVLTTYWKNRPYQTSFIATPVHIVILWGVMALVEICPSFYPFRRSYSLEQSDASNNPGGMDQGARKEADRLLLSVRNPQNVLEVRQLRKTHSNGIQAVRCVTFGAVAGEICGLLGPNGAGKTTSLSVIVGESAATAGTCEVRTRDGIWLSSRGGASTGSIGYCPQHNPLWDSITVDEHLKLYADIRGVPSGDVQRQITSLTRGLGLTLYRAMPALHLSAGSRRRLCLAIALLGDPALIVIDEASTGVDPSNKRFIWDTIRGMLSDRRSVLITTHSMEEVEALCSRVGIMNQGRMVAFGTVQQLRSLHGDAYTLDLLLKQESETTLAQKKAEIRRAVEAQFSGAVLLEELSLCMQFCVPKKAVSRLSGALGWLTENQGRLGVQYCALYQMSLDQVFVKLAKQYDSSPVSDWKPFGG